MKNQTQCPECGEDCGTECTQQQRQHTAQVDADERKDK